MPAFRSSRIAILLLCAIVPTGLGIMPSPALVARLMGGEAGERFPCEAGHCGCFSAASCWDHCCCLTPAQQVAWARAAGVTPPQRVLARLASRERDAASCCAKPHRETTAEAAAPAGCGALGSALACRGAPLWIVLAVVPLVPGPARWKLPPLQPTAQRVAVATPARPPAVGLDVPTPPPQRG